MSRSNTPDTAATAAEWFARLHSGQCTPHQEAAFLNWLIEDPHHAAQYQKCVKMWEVLGDVPRNAFVREGLPLWRRREFLAAASVLMSAGGVFLVSRKAEAETYRTGVGEQRRISLKDGSDLILDTDSHLKFTFGITTRCAEILRGRVYISTAPEGTLPLTVKCGRWEISTRNGDMDICEDQEKFSAYFRNGHGTARSEEGIRQNLTAGDRMTAGVSRVVIDHPDPAVMKAWKSGQLIFRDTSLAQAAAQMNRYSNHKLLIDDPKAAAMHISGVYSAGKCLRFARTVALLLPIRVYRNTLGIHITSLSEN